MKNKLATWIYTDAKWWEFWLPQSGLVGGLICGAIFLLAIQFGILLFTLV